MAKFYDDWLIQMATRISIVVHMVGVMEDADEGTIEYAKEVTRGELVSLLRAEGKYCEPVQGLVDGTVSEGHVLVLVAKTCVRKIADYRGIDSLMECAAIRQEGSQ